MNNDMVKNNTIEQLLRDGWIVLAGDLKKKRSVYKITSKGEQRYATLVIILYGDEKNVSKKSMLGGPKLSKLDNTKWTKMSYDDLVNELASNGMLTQSSEGLELSERGMEYVKTMFEIRGKPKSDPLDDAVGGSAKGEDKVAGYLLKAVTVMGKIADGGAKMDRMLNGGGSKKKGNTKKGKNKKSYVPRPKRQPTINNNYYYQFNAKPKTKRTNTKKKQEKKSEDFNTDYSEFYKIG